MSVCGADHQRGADSAPPPDQAAAQVRGADNKVDDDDDNNVDNNVDDDDDDFSVCLTSESDLICMWGLRSLLCLCPVCLRLLGGPRTQLLQVYAAAASGLSEQDDYWGGRGHVDQPAWSLVLRLADSRCTDVSTCNKGIFIHSVYIYV